MLLKLFDKGKADEMADTSENFYNFSMHDLDNEVYDSACKVKALCKFLNDPLPYTWAAEFLSSKHTHVPLSAPERLFSEATHTDIQHK